MIAMTLAEIAAAVDGTVVDGPDDVRVTGGVAIDSRAVQPGGLFVALQGERVDGHDFAYQATESGAAAVLAARSVGVPAVVVDDVVAALGALARTVLSRLSDVTVVGVTGSTGKTTTKDLLAALLRRLGPTIAPPGSFNNEIGHPYTVLSADESTRYLVLEYSARGVGHIDYLARIAPPQIAAVLNVGTAHIGGFGSMEGIARAKGELVEALPSDGVAVLNADDELVAGMRDRTSARVVTYGLSETADVRASDVSVDADGRASYQLFDQRVRLQLVGEHQVGNSLAAAAIALQLGLSVADVAATLSDTGAASHWRMEVARRADGVTIVNDAYNANPESMRAALATVQGMARGGRLWAVLGEMAELGADAKQAHEAAGAQVAELGFDRLVGVGETALVAGASAAGMAEGRAVQVPDIESAIALLREELQSGDVVLVKASRAVGLERVALTLQGDVQ